MHFRKNVNPMLEKLGTSSTVFFKSKNEFDSLSRRNGTIPSAYNSKIKFIDEIVSNKTQKVKSSEQYKEVTSILGDLSSPSIAIIKVENKTKKTVIRLSFYGGTTQT